MYRGADEELLSAVDSDFCGVLRVSLPALQLAEMTGAKVDDLRKLIDQHK